MNAHGKHVNGFGVVLAVAGGVLLWGARVPWLGELPGDFEIRKNGIQLYVPLTTSLLLSLIAGGIFWIASFFRRKEP